MSGEINKKDIRKLRFKEINVTENKNIANALKRKNKPKEKKEFSDSVQFLASPNRKSLNNSLKQQQIFLFF